MLEPLFSLLQIISGAPVVDQRTLAARAGVSVGKVNALLRQAEQEGYLLAGREGKKSRLTLTPKGRQLLEDTLIDRSGVKLSFPPAGGADTAVILAGGRRSEFDIPVCLQPIGEEEGVTIIDRMLSLEGVSSLDALMDIIPSYVETNMPTSKMTEFARQQLSSMQPWTIESLSLDNGVNAHYLYQASLGDLSDAYVFSRQDVQYVEYAYESNATNPKMSDFQFDFNDLSKGKKQFEDQEEYVWSDEVEAY